MKDRLKIIREFQSRFPDSHVGGSIGLFLHGIDLKRSFDKSDVDMTVPEKIDFSQPIDIENVEESSHPEDFDYQFRFYPDRGSRYIKIDINILPEKKYVILNHGGVDYRVSKIEDILAWKHHYSMKGAGKHTDDLETIRTGVRPKEGEPKAQPVATTSEVDDLPF